MAAYKQNVDEGTSHLFTTTLVDEDDNAVALASITAITMTLVETISSTVINSRTAQDVKNTNDCTFHATSGLFSYSIPVADTAIINPSAVPIGKRENHSATISFTWSSGTKAAHKELVLRVLNLRSVT